MTAIMLKNMLNKWIEHKLPLNFLKFLINPQSIQKYHIMISQPISFNPHIITKINNGLLTVDCHHII